MAAMYATLGDVAIYKCPNGHPYAVANCTRTTRPANATSVERRSAMPGMASHTLAARQHWWATRRKNV